MRKERQKTWWEEGDGATVRQWFEAWGAVTRERKLTGDPTAVPSMDSGGAGANRSSPSNVSDIELRYLEVEDFLGTAGIRSVHRELLAFVYAWAEVVETVDKAVYELKGGGDPIVKKGPLLDRHGFPLPADQQPDDRRPPARFKAVTVHTSRRRVYDLGRFQESGLDEFCAAWGAGLQRKRAFLEAEHVSLGKRFAAAKLAEPVVTP